MDLPKTHGKAAPGIKIDNSDSNNKSHKTLEHRVAESGVPLTFGSEIDWGEPKGNEIW